MENKSFLNLFTLFDFLKILIQAFFCKFNTKSYLKLLKVIKLINHLRIILLFILRLFGYFR